MQGMALKNHSEVSACSKCNGMDNDGHAKICSYDILLPIVFLGAIQGADYHP